MRDKTKKTRYAIFYKSHGGFIGPYNKKTYSKKRIDEMKKYGELNWLSNYVLKSPLQLRRRFLSVKTDY